MRVLLIDDDPISMQALLELLSKKRIKAVAPLRSIQEGIETIEAQAETISFAVCNYRGGSPALTKLFLQISANVPSIVFTEKNAKMDHLALLPRGAKIDFLERSDLPGFLRVVDRLCEDGILETRLAPDADFVRIPIAGLNLEKPPPVDFFLRMAPDRYCLRFRKEDGLDRAALDHYKKQGTAEYLYVRKEALDGWVEGRNGEIDALLNESSQPTESTRQVAEDNLEIVHNVVSQLGFTPKVEELAKKTVALTLKALGSSPQLSDILRKMQLQEGKYISSHSLMLAELSCALAHRLTWSSAPTFLKLTVASFLHDLHLPTNRLARMRILADITEANGFTAADLHAFKTHPIQAAEYSRQLRQLPADVDTIVLQHHEQPDGTGFPRGLYHHQISPLACVFIVAQDLLDHYLTLSASGQLKPDLFQSFLEQREGRYAAGTFKKIFDSMKTGEPAPQI
ncbi:MAG: HD-GYP domain-containing protein [Bdellovibrionota bacterium]